MQAIKYRELRRMYELNGPRQTVRHLNEALSQGHLRPDDFSFRDLAEATLGPERVRALDPRHGETVLEAGDGVDVTAFSNINGQVIQAKVLEAYRQEAFVLSRLVDTIPTSLDGEKLPGIGHIADMLDPNTAELVLVLGTTVLVTPDYRHAAHRVFRAAEITYTAAGAETATTAAS